MNINQDFITQNKKTELEAELKILKEVRRKEIADTLEKARSMGDLSENAEYHQAREDQAYNEDRINEIENTLRNAKVVNSKLKTDSITVGSTVIITKKGERKDKTITIVGHQEVDATTGKIAFDSPLGLALMGKKEGEEVIMLSPKGEIVYKIKEVN